MLQQKLPRGWSLFVTTAITILSLGSNTLTAQDPTYRQDFQGAPDGRWVPVPLDVQNVPGSTGQKALRFSRPGAAAVLQQMVNPKSVTFLLQAASPADSFMIAVSRSCDGGTTWTTLREVPMAGNGLVVGVAQVDVTVDIIGTCNIRWLLATAIRGEAFVDDVTVARLGEADSIRVALGDEIQRQAVIAEQVRTLAEARLDLLRTDSLARDAAHSLADIATDAYTFQSLNQLGIAVSSRATLANPLNYPDYQRVEAELLRIAPPAVKAHVESQTSAIQNLFSGIQKAISGNWLGAVANIADAVPAIRQFRSTFQGTFALLVGRGGELTGNVTKSGEPRAVTAQKLYLSSDSILHRMQQETDSLVHSMTFAVGLAAQDEQTAALADSALGDLIALAGLRRSMTPRDLRLAIRRSRTGGDAADRQMVLEFERQLHAMNTVVRTTGDRTDITNRTRSLLDVLSRVPTIQRRFRTLLVQQEEFFAQQVRYLCNVAPLVGASDASQRLWETNARAALRAMRLAQLSFHRAQIQGPVPAVPSPCPVDTELRSVQLSSSSVPLAPMSGGM